jgi:ariadne-1
MCLICLSDEELMGEECGHQFCIYCWRDFLHKEVKLKHTVILCPGKDCSKVLDELTVIGYLDDEDTKDRFRETLVQSFVDDNQLVRWCPAANCTNAIVLHEVLESKNEGVTCTCGMTFCFRCGVETDHRPNSCRVFAEWTKKQGGGDTSLNDQLIATISRQCPKCNTSIQKNGGCNHMK